MRLFAIASAEYEANRSKGTRDGDMMMAATACIEPADPKPGEEELAMDDFNPDQDSAVTLRSAMSDIGAIAVAVRSGVVTGVRFGYATEQSAMAALANSPGCKPIGRLSGASDTDKALAADVLERLQRFAQGEPVDLRDVPVAVDHLSAFQRRVVKACRAIPTGERRTYGQLAAAAGSPGAARAVGQVMATNRVPLVVPCHRVVASGGGLGGFSAPQGLAMKRRLLSLEEASLAGAAR
jgi:methylated-DNA-[protein]-cysteine S-methyltransferase